MTNGIEPIALTVDGTDVQTDGLGMHCRIVRGLNESPTVRGIDDIVPGRAGRIPRSRVADELTIELECYVSGATAAAYRTNALALRELFDPTQDAVVVSATLEDGSTATINARTMPTAVWLEDLILHEATVSIEMQSVDPDWVIVPAP